MTIYDISPKLKLFHKGTCFKAKHDMIAHNKAGVSSMDKTLGFDPVTKEIKKNTVLIFLEDKQFFSPSKELRQPMSAWVRAKVITPLGDIVWITLLCENKSIWDFKTYTNKKNSIVSEINRSFQVISLSLESPTDVLIKENI